METIKRTDPQQAEFDAMVEYAIKQAKCQTLTPNFELVAKPFGTGWALLNEATGIWFRGTKAPETSVPIIYGTEEDAWNASFNIHCPILETRDMARLRCMWTTYCLHHNIAYQSEQYAAELKALWEQGKLHVRENGYTRHYDAYELYMNEFMWEPTID